MASSSPLPAEDVAYEDISRPLSGPGTSRHTRRLQLRNAKFQGSSLPTRKVTPQSQTSSSNWSAVGDVLCSSDMENRSPGGTEAAATFVSSVREPSGALREINNASLPRPKKSKARTSLGKLFSEDSGSFNSLKYDSTSPEGQRTSLLPRAVRLRAKPGHARQSLNTETRKYIEHLETELSATQQQLSVATSPSLTREQSSRMRNLSTETKHLHDELADWEAKYEQRVEEAVDSHRESEARLRARVRLLEQEAEDAKIRVQDLSGQLETASQTLDAVETANVNLEKRLEIMSGIMAAAPNKIDLHVDIPGRPRSARPRSMLPRFPTAGTLIASPDRQQPCHASSPSVLNALPGSSIFDPSVQGPISPAGFSSDAESYFSESSTGPGAIENPWGIPQTVGARNKPMRRMRRFGAGSFGPKPLILPSTSSHEQNPMSAPLLDRNNGEAVFPFPPPSHHQGSEFDHHHSATVENESIAARIFASPLLNIMSPSTEDDVDETLLCAQSPPAASEKSGPDFSSLGPATGRNLMDELAAMQASDLTASVDMLSNHSGAHSHTRQDNIEDPNFHEACAEPSTPEMQVLSSSALIVASHDWHLFHPRSGSGHLGSAPSSHRNRTQPIHLTPNSAFDRLNRLFFGEFWRNPIILARHLVRTARSRMRLPDPLLNVQWWLVGVLLGPMARRRMLGDPNTTTSAVGGEQEVVVVATDVEEVDGEQKNDDNTLAYGAMYSTPPGSPELSSLSVLPSNNRSTNSLVAGKGKKRAASPSPSPRSDAEAYFKHSPWLWLKFSITLAFAVGVAFKDGPASLMHQPTPLSSSRKAGGRSRSGHVRRARRDPWWVLTP